MSLVWVVDDDKSIRWVLEKTLNKQHIDCELFASPSELLRRLTQVTPDVIVSDVRMDGMDGLSLMGQVHEHYPDLPVIIMTAHSDLDSAVASFQGGAFEYLPKPFDLNEAITLVKRALEHAAKQAKSQRPAQASAETEIIGEAPAMQEVFRAIGRLSQSHINVLINGQSGTGKELVAKALHKHSPRKANPFIALNMAAIPRELMESELFGHEKGAFTGANTLRQGRFEQANNGTLFLDEIGDMPPETQTRLLRVLADGVFYRVGGHVPIKVDVRIIAATHQDLEKLVREGHFREDLFHRLNVIRIHIPKLSERREDIKKLLNHYLIKAAKELQQSPKTLRADTLAYLERLPWPGNVRQLENTCRWITVMASGQEVMIEDLPPELKQPSTGENQTASASNWHQSLASWADQRLSDGESQILQQALPMFERTLIKVALKHTSGRKREAAELLGWGRNTLTRKLKELNFSEQEDI